MRHIDETRLFAHRCKQQSPENQQQSKITIAKGRDTCNQGLVSRWGLAPTVFRYETSLGRNPETLTTMR